MIKGEKMNEKTKEKAMEKYEKFDLETLQNMLDEKYKNIALIANNKFNLERKYNEINNDITQLRKEIARKISKEKTNQNKGKDNAK